MPLARQEINGFLGVNLRKDRASLADQELARAINADLHSQIGTCILRLPRSPAFSTSLTDKVIRRLAKINGHRYAIAGQSIYRDQVRIGDQDALSSNLITTMTAFRPLSDSTTWAFIADDAIMQKASADEIQQWGIDAPEPGSLTEIAVGPAGLLTGAYTAVYTYIRFDGTAVAHESNPSGTPAPVTLANQQLTITIQRSDDPQVNGYAIYRTVAGGIVHLLDARVRIADDDTSTTFTYTSSIADSALGAEVEEDNNPPPQASWVTEFQSHLVLSRVVDNQHYLWFSKRFRPESFPLDNFLEIGNPDDPLQCSIRMSGLLAVLTRRTKYRVVGNATSGFVAQEALSARGTPSPLAALATERGLVFVARDGVFLTNVIAEDQEVSASIAPLFFGESVNDYEPINWDAAETIAAAYYKGRYYLSLPTGTATTPNVMAVLSTSGGSWYFFDHPARSLYSEEDTDRLLAGFTDGIVYILEDAAGTPESTEIDWQKDGSGGSLSVRKLFQWAKVDIDTLGESVTVELYVDGVLKRTTAVSGTRRKVLLNFPAASLGYTWRIRVRYTGRRRIRWYGCEVLAVPFEAA